MVRNLEPISAHLQDSGRVDLRDVMVRRLTGKPRPASHMLSGLGGLYECPCIDVGTREKFEENVTESLLNISVNRSVTYLSVACGGLFPDLLILRRLALAGRKVTAVLVDSLFTAFVNENSHKDSFEEQKCKNLPLVQLAWIGDDLNNLQGQLIHFPRYSTTDLIANFAGWLNWRAPFSCRVVVFSSLEDYLNHVKCTGQLVADVGVGCDLPFEVMALASRRVPRLLCLHSASKR